MATSDRLCDFERVEIGQRFKRGSYQYVKIEPNNGFNALELITFGLRKVPPMEEVRAYFRHTEKFEPIKLV